MYLSQLLPLQGASASRPQLLQLSLLQQKPHSLPNAAAGRPRSLCIPSLKRQLKRKSKNSSQNKQPAAAYKQQKQQQRRQHVNHHLLLQKKKN
jgi:hypothetical protein